MKGNIKRKLKVYVLPVGNGEYQAQYIGSRGTTVCGTSSKSERYAKQSFTALMNELQVPRHAWEFYHPK